MKVLVGVLQSLLCFALHAQMTWSPLLPPSGGSQCYDSVRDRLVVSSWPLTHEFDGTNWTTLAAAGGGPLMAFDRVRGRTVAIGPTVTEEWDGGAWTVLATAPPMVVYPGSVFVCFHAGRGRVVALSPTYVPSFPLCRLELYEWDGTSWVHIPAWSPLVINNNLPGASDWNYYGLAYDARRDKLVVFGRYYFLAGQYVEEAATWEWDAVNGWVSFGVSGPADYSHLWFDEHRGVVLRATVTAAASTVLRWDSAQGWLPIATLLGIPPNGGFGAYDSNRNRYYISTFASSLVAITDLNPAQYAFHGPACAVSNPPGLGLSQPWTRAWLGSVLQVTATDLPQSIGFLATGLSDLQYGSTPLPLNLASYGMPGCVLHVAPDATTMLVGANNTATQQIPIPNDLSLLGVAFWQQVLALAPGANPTGMLTSPSMRGTVGRAY